MFGLDSQHSENETPEFFFDIENELRSSPEKFKEMQDKIIDKLNQLKKLLDAGVNPEQAPKLHSMIEGYSSVAKILTAMKVKLNTK